MKQYLYKHLESGSYIVISASEVNDLYLERFKLIGDLDILIQRLHNLEETNAKLEFQLRQKLIS